MNKTAPLWVMVLAMIVAILVAVLDMRQARKCEDHGGTLLTDATGKPVCVDVSRVDVPR